MLEIISVMFTLMNAWPSQYILRHLNFPYTTHPYFWYPLITQQLTCGILVCLVLGMFAVSGGGGGGVGEYRNHLVRHEIFQSFSCFQSFVCQKFPQLYLFSACGAFFSYFACFSRLPSFFQDGAIPCLFSTKLELI